jgi:hypothetical protein
MAIKTQLVSGQRRIITKVVNGVRRVSCSCCEEAGGCCMYPAQGLTDGLYTTADLPDEIVMYYGDGTNFEGPTTASKSGNQYAAANILVELEPAGMEWIKSYFQLSPGTFCLIDGLEQELSSFGDTYVLVFDNFEDTYTINTNSGSVVVTRESLCIWSGFDVCGAKWQLVYGDASTLAGGLPVSTQELRWNIITAEVNNPCEDAPDYGNGIGWKNDGENNTPVGNYPNGPIPEGATVSA